MSKEQKVYVGARYVPIFTDLENNEWQAGYSYERLTIVLYNNDSYTSKVYVPSTIGNPAENPDYWVRTGNYNIKLQQVDESLTQEISNRKDADTTLQNNINNEEKNREENDNALQTSINNVNDERTQKDNELQQSIETEIKNRNDADVALQNSINEVNKNLNDKVTEIEKTDESFQNDINTLKETSVTNVSITNENGVYAFKQTIDGVEKDMGSVEVPQNDPVLSVSDDIVSNDNNGYDFHTLNENKASGTSNEVMKLYVAQKQITDISLDETGNNIVIKFVDQSGTETEKTITIKESTT